MNGIRRMNMFVFWIIYTHITKLQKSDDFHFLMNYLWNWLTEAKEIFVVAARKREAIMWLSAFKLKFLLTIIQRPVTLQKVFLKVCVPSKMWWIPITPYAEVCILRVSLRDREFFRNTEKSEILNVKNNGTTLHFFFFFFWRYLHPKGPLELF